MNRWGGLHDIPPDSWVEFYIFAGLNFFPTQDLFPPLDSIPRIGLALEHLYVCAWHALALHLLQAGTASCVTILMGPSVRVALSILTHREVMGNRNFERHRRHRHCDGGVDKSSAVSEESTESRHYDYGVLRAATNGWQAVHGTGRVGG